MLRLLLAAFHLLGLGVGLGAVWARAAALSGPLDGPGMRRALAADAWWGVAALLWLGTGLWRLLAGVEKPTGFYLSNHLFWTKLGLFVLILALEIRPATVLTRWRLAGSRGGVPDTTPAAGMATTSRVQAFLVVAMVLVATAMARGVGAP